jgi:leader peptidase (prepilin peptidase) / N-methyltransferase
MLTGSTFFYFNLFPRIIILLIFGIPLILSDIRHRTVPLEIMVPAIAAAFAAGIAEKNSPGLPAVEFLAGFLIFRLARTASAGGLGTGDALFSGFTALLTGFPGWFAAVMCAAAGALIYSILILGMGIRDRRTKLPFIPFLAAGTLSVLSIQTVFS